MRKKTYKGWLETTLDLDKYLAEPCVIDSDLYHFILACAPFKSFSLGLIQGGDSEEHGETEDGEPIEYYMTISEVDDRYFYLGILPEFRQ